ncbi:DMT family transporter [Maribacter polysiphoniae]|uniref:DMT family transporter n=1 Tax=Maribacter polysiphoniae TaxID=429344 RepID=A0A316E0N7_9FLAO|nr:DMT family transporter [Maribacter polysiphoniae]MBD1261222.1 DMT family transporter [Maribacter polysiphoniae]PWK23536.1 glucose uptake protein GlcU [Maribacter polysiphoniae]
MLDLALSVLCSSLIFVIFKLYEIYRIETPYAIITNYVVACSVGLFFYSGEVKPLEIAEQPWFLGTLLLGVLFIVVFNLMAKTSQTVGVSVASVATKMSLVIPVIFGILVYKETLGFLKVVGILLALAAVYFASIKKKEIKFERSSLLLPILVFLGSGIIDTSIKYVQETKIKENEFPLFSATVFAAAAFVGLFFIIFKAFKTPLKINVKNILGGIALGVPNYFSIYYLLRALQNPTLNSASVFTINNVAIVMLSTLLGIVLFKEQISPKNWGGIVLAIISIILVAVF